MIINEEFLKKLYGKLNADEKEEQNIKCYDDFIDYIKETIIDNLYYDFTINGAISREKMFGVGFNGK